jgi:hypothetical protein
MTEPPVISAVHVYHDPRSTPCERCHDRAAIYRADVTTLPGVTRLALCSTCAALTVLEWEDLLDPRARAA